MPKIDNLKSAKRAKNDEFYTQSSDIEAELKHYQKHFKDQIVYCNCDDPIESNFWHYFYRSFGFLGLKKLISTHYEQSDKPSYALIYEGGYDNAPKFNKGVKWIPLKGNGDFRSEECINYLKQADIVITNPPFSLFREYVQQLIIFHKKFLIWGNQNAITYKEFFPLLMQRKVWIGSIANKTCVFKISDDYKKWDEKETAKRNDGHHYAKVPAITTFTNMSLNKPTDQMVVWKAFDQKNYPAYDNFGAFEVSKVADLPKDEEIEAIIDSSNLKGWQDTYHDDLQILSNDGKKAKIKVQRPIWGVPITVLDKYNPESNIEQHNLAKDFDILGLAKGPTWNSINHIDAYKKYQNAKQINTKGKISTGGKVNTAPNIIMNNPKGTYYLADNASGKIKSLYARVFLRHIK